VIGRFFGIVHRHSLGTGRTIVRAVRGGPGNCGRALRIRSIQRLCVTARTRHCRLLSQLSVAVAVPGINCGRALAGIVAVVILAGQVIAGARSVAHGYSLLACCSARTIRRSPSDSGRTGRVGIAQRPGRRYVNCNCYIATGGSGTPWIPRWPPVTIALAVLSVGKLIVGGAPP